MTQFQVTAVWWPDGWEPGSPLDVPNCLGRVAGQDVASPSVDLKQALATVRGLNRQNMDHPGTTWYVVTEADAPPSASAGAADRPLRVIEPVEGSGRGDCSHCPASSFPCAAEKP